MLSVSAQGQESNLRSLLVLYPERAGNSIYDAVNDGIREQARQSGIRVRFDAVSSGAEARGVAEATPGNDVIIALGRENYEALQESSAKNRIVVGGVDLPASTASSVSGVTLLTEPSMALRRLRSISPGTERVFMVYEPGRHEWLIEAARKYGREIGIEIVALPATTLSEATSHYWNIFKYANPKRDALWLLQSSVLVSDRDTLPRIIEESWTKRFVVFSNSLPHVDRGVVFAVYVDPEGLGKELVRKAVAKSRGETGVIPSTAHQSALNVRIARHHGLRITPAERNEFDVVLEGQ